MNGLGFLSKGVCGQRAVFLLGVLSLSVAPLFWAPVVVAQESVGNTITGSYTSDLLGLRKEIESLRQRIAAVTQTLMVIKSCHEQGKFYATPAGSTVPQCVEVFTVS